jgi:hypothetical protein
MKNFVNFGYAGKPGVGEYFGLAHNSQCTHLMLNISHYLSYCCKPKHVTGKRSKSLWRYPFLLCRTLTVSRFPFFFGSAQSIGLLGRVIGQLQGIYLSKGEHKHRINARAHAHTNTLNIHALSGIRIHDHSVRVSEDSSSLRQLGYRDRLASERAKTVHVLDSTATMTG